MARQSLPFTNLATIIEEGFRNPSEEASNRFSGWNEAKKSYDQDSWQYEGFTMPSALAEHYLDTTESFSELASRLHDYPPHQDQTLQHPMCVYQILRRHYPASQRARQGWRSAS